MLWSDFVCENERSECTQKHGAVWFQLIALLCDYFSALFSTIEKIAQEIIATIGDANNRPAASAANAEIKHKPPKQIDTTFP